MKINTFSKMGLIAVLVSGVALDASAQRDDRGNRGGDRPARSEPPSRRESAPRAEPRSAPPQRSQPSFSQPAPRREVQPQRSQPSSPSFSQPSPRREVQPQRSQPAPSQQRERVQPSQDRQRPSTVPNRVDTPSRREQVRPSQPSQPSVVSPRRDENRMSPRRNDEQQSPRQVDRRQPEPRRNSTVNPGQDSRVRPDVRNTPNRQDSRVNLGNNRVGPGRTDSRVRQDTRSQPQRPIVNRSHRRNFEAPVQRRVNGVSVYERNRMRRNGANSTPRYYDHNRWGRYDLYVYRPHWQYRSTFWPFYHRHLASPWHYDWRWRTSTWYIGWSWYYSPYPYYYSASYWVTDYVISDLLREQYEEGYSDGFRDGWDAARDSSYGITEDYKEQIRTQVDQTATAFQNNTSVSLDQVLQDSAYIFAVDTELTVLDQHNNTCTLSGGDLLRVNQRPTTQDVSASMIVVTSKGASCPAGTVVEVSITDLQEMLNTFNEKVDDGLKQAQDLQQRQN